MDAWLLGLIGRPSSGDGFGREVLLLLALCHDHDHRHCRRHVENVPLFVLLLLPIVSVLSTLCVRVYAADGRSLGPSDCRLVCRWCAVMEESSFGRLLGVSVPVCLYACVRIGIGGGH